MTRKSKIEKLIESGDKSLLSRRSGIGICNILTFLNWYPEVIHQVGVGVNAEEWQCLDFLCDQPEFFAVEPHPQSFLNLQEKYPGEMLPIAFSNYCGSGTLYWRNRHKDGASLLPHEGTIADGYDQSVPIIVRQLDKVWEPVPDKKSLLWLDCEGTERKVLDCATEFLKHTDMINVELTSNPPGLGWDTPIQIHEILHRFGFVRQFFHTTKAYAGQVDCVYVKRKLFDSRWCTCTFTLKMMEHDT